MENIGKAKHLMAKKNLGMGVQQFQIQTVT
jgi:hypothetical protein